MKTTQHRTIKKMLWYNIVFICVGVVFFSLASHSFAQRIIHPANHYEIGVLVSRDKEHTVRAWSPMAEYLTDHIDNVYFSIVPLNYDDIDLAVENKRVDFVVANPMIFVELAYFDDVQRIASLKRLVRGKEYRYYGGVVFARADRKDILDLLSLAGKRVAAVHQHSFAGWVLAAREFQFMDWSLERDFEFVSFLGSNAAVVNAVLAREADFGVVRTGILEEMADEGKISLSDFKIIHLRKHTKEPGFIHSTDIFPEWSMGKLDHVPDLISQQLVEILFNIPEGHEALTAAGCAGWVLPYNYASIRRTLIEMREDFFEISSKRAFYLIFKDYWRVFVLGIFVLTYLIILTINRSLLSRRLVRSKEILQKELVEHKKAEESLRESRSMLQNVLDLIPARVFWKDRESVFLGCNKVVARDAGVSSPQELVGKTDHEFPWREQADHYREDDRRVMESGKPFFNIIEPQTHEKGEVIWLRTHKVPMRNDKGEVIGVLGTYEDITESKRAQEALEKSEAKYRELVENANSIILRLNLEGQILFFNEFAQKFFGFTEEEILGKNVVGTIVPEKDSEGRDLTKMVKIIIDGMMGGDGQYHIHENENIKKNGERVWIAWSNRVIVSDSGEKEVLTIGNDVTERRRMEEDLLRLSHSVEQSQNSIVITDKKGIIEYINPKFTEVTGYTKEDAIGKNPHILRSGDMPREIYQELWQTITNGETWRGEFHNRKKNGDLFWERATISPIKDRFGETSHYLAVKEDITQEKKLAQDLQNAFGRLKEMERIINLSSAIVFMWSPQKKDAPVKFVSDNIRLLGYEPEDFYVRGMKIRDFILDDDRTMVAETVRRNIRERRLEFSHQYRVKTQADKIRWFEDHSFVTYAKSGEPEYIQGVAFDITERRIAEERILEAVNMKSEFISIVSHELRTPLTAVKESINIVTEEEAGELNDVQRKFLGIAKRNVDRLGALINDVLDYQKLDMGKLHFDQKDVDVRPLVKESVRTMEIVAKNKALDLVLEAPEGDQPRVSVDADRIIQVLNNLINNAIKFTEQGHILVKVQYLSDRVQISIKDTGIGIKAKDMHKLFQTFSQVRSGSERRSGETGLGLAISKKIIDSHGGAIWAESIFGEGSTFTFTLPFKV